MKVNQISLMYDESALRVVRIGLGDPKTDRQGFLGALTLGLEKLFVPTFGPEPSY